MQDILVSLIILLSTIGLVISHLSFTVTPSSHHIKFLIMVIINICIFLNCSQLCYVTVFK